MRIQGSRGACPKQLSFPEISALRITQHPEGTLNILITPPPPPSEFLSGCGSFGQSLPGGPSLSHRARPLPGRGQASFPKFPVTPPSGSSPSRPHSERQPWTQAGEERATVTKREAQTGGPQNSTPGQERAQRAAAVALRIAWPRPQPVRARPPSLESETHPLEPEPIGRAPPPGRWWRRGLGADRQHRLLFVPIG